MVMPFGNVTVSIVSHAAPWHSTAYAVEAVTRRRQSRFCMIAVIRAAYILDDTSRAADFRMYASFSRIRDGVAIAIEVEAMRSTKQDSISDMRFPFEKAQRALSSYSLARHYRNENILERRRDLPDRIHLELQPVPQAADLTSGL